MRTRRIHWDYPDVDVTVVIYYEEGDREHPASAEIEKIFVPHHFPEKDVSRVFNEDYIMDRFWELRPDLEG